MTIRTETQTRPTDIALRPWSEGDLPLLERLLGNPQMTEHLGGPESSEQLRRRHLRYLGTAGTETGTMFVITVGPEELAAGSVGYWEHEWRGETVWETGWTVLPEFQGRGIATRGTILAVERATAEGRHGSIHAFPAVANGPSNAICRNVGFTLLGEADFEYPKGSYMRCNDWALDL